MVKPGDASPCCNGRGKVIAGSPQTGQRTWDPVKELGTACHNEVFHQPAK